MANGFILIDKQVGNTSRSVDNKIQRLFHTRKVGHLGTLDPFATGLLIIAVDKGCKSLPFIDDSFKTYRALLKLGTLTDTGDLTGNVIGESEVPNIDKERVLEVFESFIGESEQIPPMSSALHHNGQRLYDLARRGVTVYRKPRKIVIKSLKLHSFDGICIDFEVNCSRGTYVRTLAEDIAKSLGTCGYLESLRRTAIGNISVDSAKPIDEINEKDLINPVELISLKHVVISDAQIIKNIKDGKDVELDEKDDQILLCTYENDELVALAVYNRYNGNIYSPVRGLW